MADGGRNAARRFATAVYNLKDDNMTIHSNRPLAADTRFLLANAAAIYARKLEEQRWQDDGGRTIAVAPPSPPPIGDPPR